MTDQKFSALVRELEIVARRDPSGYRTRVFLLAAFGYGFILLVLFTALALLYLVGRTMLEGGQVGSGDARILIFAIVFVVVILRALWVRFPKPEGVPILPADAPALFETIERQRAALKSTTRFHEVLLTTEFNAAVAQRPRLGVLGWQVNTLLIGLPLLESLTPEQFEGVLAHELGHLRGGHGRFSGWIYRVNATWQRLLEQLGRQGIGAILMEAFFKWYAPYFAAYSFALRRADEYEADRAAADLVGARVMADALCLLPARAQFLDAVFWEKLARRVATLPEPPADPFREIASALREETPLSTETAEKALRAALSEETGTGDTHPSLTDRLAALKEKPRLPENPLPEADTAAQWLFGTRRDAISARLSAQWRADVAPSWQRQHQAAKNAIAGLAELDARRDALTIEEAWQRAAWTETYRSEADALPLYRALLEREPAHAGANFAVGRLLVPADDANGIPHLERAMQADPDAILPSLQILHEYHKRRGEHHIAKGIYERALGHARAFQSAEAERGDMGPNARFYPNDLDVIALGRLSRAIAAYPDVAAAYLARKDVRANPQKPVYVLVIQTRANWRRPRYATFGVELARQMALELDLPGETYIIPMAGDTASLATRIRKAAGPPIYRA